VCVYGIDGMDSRWRWHGVDERNNTLRSNNFRRAERQHHLQFHRIDKFRFLFFNFADKCFMSVEQNLKLNNKKQHNLIFPYTSSQKRWSLKRVIWICFVGLNWILNFFYINAKLHIAKKFFEKIHEEMLSVKCCLLTPKLLELKLINRKFRSTYGIEEHILKDV